MFKVGDFWAINVSETKPHVLYIGQVTKVTDKEVTVRWYADIQELKTEKDPKVRSNLMKNLDVFPANTSDFQAKLDSRKIVNFIAAQVGPKLLNSLVYKELTTVDKGNRLQLLRDAAKKQGNVGKPNIPETQILEPEENLDEDYDLNKIKRNNRAMESKTR